MHQGVFHVNLLNFTFCLSVAVRNFEIHQDPEDFSGAVFTCAHSQEIAQISRLSNFQYISEGIPSLMRFWLLMT